MISTSAPAARPARNGRTGMDLSQEIPWLEPGTKRSPVEKSSFLHGKYQSQDEAAPEIARNVESMEKRSNLL